MILEIISRVGCGMMLLALLISFTNYEKHEIWKRIFAFLSFGFFGVGVVTYVLRILIP